MEWFAALPMQPRMGHDESTMFINKEVKRTMTKRNVKGEVKVPSIDLSKRSFQLHGVNEAGQVMLRGENEGSIVVVAKTIAIQGLLFLGLTLGGFSGVLQAQSFHTESAPEWDARNDSHVAHR